MSFKLFTAFFCICTLRDQVTEADNILALFVNGHRSHLLVYASVMNLLIQRGHNVTVVTTLDVKDVFDVESIRWLKISDNYTETVITFGSSLTNGLDRIERMLTRIESTSKFMQDQQWQAFLKEENNYDLLIMGYLFNDYQLGLAAHFNCPVVLIWTGQPIGFVQSLMGNPEERWYVTQPYDSHQYKGLRAIAFGWFEKFVEFLALEKMREIYEKHFPVKQYPSFKEIRKRVSLVLCNHHSLSEGPIAPYLPGIIEIGGIANKVISQENYLELSRLITSKTEIIYFSFGSRVKWSLLPITLEETFIEAFRNFPNFTILWTYDKNCTELELKFPASNVQCKSWWPQTSILASNRTKLFITHGGKGSIVESQLYGIPMLGIPFFGDQKANVDKMVKRKFGLKLHLENITCENVVKSLHLLLNCNNYGKNIQSFSKLYHDRPMSSENLAIYWLEYVLRHKGTKHMQSPLLELNILEYYLIDIYFFVLCCFISILWILKKLEMKISQAI